MRVIEKGRLSAWASEAYCTANGRGRGGCGAKLLVEQGDLYLARDMLGAPGSPAFRCPECGAQTRIAVPDSVSAKISAQGPDPTPGTLPGGGEIFRLTADHVALLRHLSVDYHEDAPCIDRKRPFGNDEVAADVAEILRGTRDSDYVDKHYAGLMAASKEAGIALQVALSAASFEPGTYQKCGYAGPWVRVGD